MKKKGYEWERRKRRSKRTTKDDEILSGRKKSQSNF